MAAEAFRMRMTRSLGHWLSRWGVDADQYHWLLQASLRMDFRSKSAFKTGQDISSTKSSLLITAFVYVIFSLILAGFLRAAHVGTFLFSSIMFGYSMAMMGMSILMEFGLVVISPDDFLILAHRPVSSRTFFAVKCSNLLFYTLLLDACLNLAPCVVGWTFPDAPWQFPLVYLIIAAVSGVFVAAAVTALYGVLLQRVNYEKFKDLLAWCQILFSFVFFFGYQIIPRLMGGLKSVHLEDVSVTAAILPPIWFASLLELGLGHFSWFAAALALISLLALALLVPVLLRSVSLVYSDRLSGMVTAAVNRRTTAKRQRDGAVMPWLERIFVYHQEEKAFFRFLMIMLRRNRQLKMQLYPNFGIVLAFFALGILEHDKMPDPLAGGNMGFATAFPLMGFLFGAMGFTALLPYSDEYQGGWIFYAAPILRPERFLKAVKKAILLVFFIPLFVLNVLLLSFMWPMAHAAAISLYGFGIGVATLQGTLFWLHAFPFSLKPEKGIQTRRFAMAFLMMMAYAVFMALPSLFSAHYLVLPIILVALFTAALALGYSNNRAYAGAIRNLEFGAQ